MLKARFRKWITDGEQLRRLKLLGTVPLFAGLTRRQLGRLIVKLFEKHYRAGEAIFREGDPGNALFIVLEGRVAITHAVDGVEKSLATLSPGTYFGELALIDEQPRFASARADEDSVLLILYKSHFDQLIEGSKTIAAHIMANLLKAVAGYVRVVQARGAIRPAPPRPSAPAAAEQNAMPAERGRR
jgi:CRP-like cAMP-binding protein